MLSIYTYVFLYVYGQWSQSLHEFLERVKLKLFYDSFVASDASLFILKKISFLMNKIFKYFFFNSYNFDSSQWPFSDAMWLPVFYFYRIVHDCLIFFSRTVRDVPISFFKCIKSPHLSKIIYMKPSSLNYDHYDRKCAAKEIK